MQSHSPGQFERDMACTEAEWLRWLAERMASGPWLYPADQMSDAPLRQLEKVEAFVKE